MIIAHLPAGYLIAKAKQKLTGTLTRSEMAAALIGAVIPDIDLLWFLTFDHRQHPHHAYVTHWPSFWLVVWVLGLMVAKARPQVLSASVVHLFTLGSLSHMVMDTVSAPIRWLAPFSNQWFELYHVPAGPNGVAYALMTYWTFNLELAICAIAALVFVAGCWNRRARAA